jgi:predicted MarR family transcription regulator
VIVDMTKAKPDNTIREPAAPGAEASGGLGPIVSSAHLVSERAAELSEFEFGLIIANNAFHRWMVRCMAATGIPDLSPLDILVLHTVNHRARAKKLADICLVLNVEDTHTVTYALKKLANLGLVDSQRKRKENLFSITPAGRDACARYREIREKCLIGSFNFLGQADNEISDLAALLRALSGLYDQAARAATSL